MHDLVVIGGGPAGLAAATFALRKRLDVVLVATRLGGRAGDHQQFAGLPMGEELLGEEVVRSFARHLVAVPQRIVDNVVVGLIKRDGIFHVLLERSTIRARAVIVATGAHPRPLGIANERELVGHGLGYSIATHAHLAAGRDVAVIGATARALRGVGELVQFARKVVLIAPEPGQFTTPLGQRLRAHPNVQLLEGYRVTAVEATGGAVHAVVVAQRDTNQRLPVQAVFVDLGLVPNVQLVRQLVQLDSQGFVVVDDQNRTSLPGLFAAGDVTSALGEQILIALGEGARAAVSAYDYILAQRLELALSDLELPLAR